MLRKPFIQSTNRPPTKRRWALAGLFLVATLAACTAEPTTVEVEVTREVIVNVDNEVEVTREVEMAVDVEVTRLVEVEVDREVEVEVTRIVAVLVDEAEAPVEEEPAGPPPYEPPTAVLAAGLAQPRQMMFTADGTLYIAEAGVAGDTRLSIDSENAIAAGLSSQITAVGPDGVQSVALPMLPSVEANPGNPGYRGGQAILVTDDTYWVAFGEGPVAFFGLPLLRTVVGFDRATWRIQEVIDIGAAASAAGQPEPNAINSDPADLALADDGTLFIADAGCNCLWTWTAADGLQAFHFWSAADNPVPTGVAVGPDGDIYVSFLSGFPFAAESTRVERWSRAGELVQTYGGLTLATDVLVTDDGTIYVVEMAAGLGDSGFIPDSGRVVIVSEDGLTSVMEGLPTPYGLAQAPNGDLYVSVVAAFDVGRNGLVIAVSDE